MKNLLNPKWIFLINTLPVILLFILFYSQYTVVASLLSAESRQLWLSFGIGLAIITTGSFGYAFWCILKKLTISWLYALLALAVNIVFLYVYAQYSHIIIPFSLPSWLMATEMEIYPGTFLMPTLAYSLFVLTVVSVPKNRKVNPWLNFLYSVLFPLAWYLFTMIILPFWQNIQEGFSTHALIVIFISSAILFLFFLCRGIYCLTGIYGNRFRNYAILWKFILAILLPLIGLLVNNGVINHALLGESPFGNFSSYWFYIIAVINGIVICLPTFTNHHYRLIRFFALTTCFPYTLYFFFVFLPYLPLAMIAIIAIGIGFLMLAPLGLFILQLNELYHEYVFFLKSYSPRMLFLGIVFAFAILPTLITLSYIRDKVILNNALAYVYDQQPNKAYAINRTSLKNTLTVLKGHKKINGAFGKNTPYLGIYYNWLVLDNLVLSDSKIETLERIFLGKSDVSRIPDLPRDERSVKISKTSVESNYDPAQEAWVSTINFELKNGEDGLSTYETTFELPTGCWISNYYLYVGKRKELGILAEKKAALWVFSQIRNENRDPGILYYESANKIGFKVFPFAKNETRKSGIELVHKAPVKLTIDGIELALGKADEIQKPKIIAVDKAVYIPANEKRKLPLVQRKPIYHFVMDVSAGKRKNVRGYINRVKKYIRLNHIAPSAVKLHFTSAQSHEANYETNWQENFDHEDFESGFYLEGALKSILLNNLHQRTGTYPIALVLTDTLKNAIMLHDLSKISYSFPESPNFFELDFEGKIWEHHYLKDPLVGRKLISEIALQKPVYVWPNAKAPVAYLPNDTLASIALNNAAAKRPQASPIASWEAALALQANVMEVDLGYAHRPDNYLQLVKQSMEAHILSPVTSFLVVENEAQKIALKRKQAQILSGNKNLDPDEDTQSMDEPNMLMLLALGITAIWIKRKYKKLRISAWPRL